MVVSGAVDFLLDKYGRRWYKNIINNQGDERLSNRLLMKTGSYNFIE